MAKLWGGRFTKGTDKAVEDFTSSIAFDARMYAEDIAGSKAHATMLAKQNIISQEDCDAIVAGLTKIKGQIDKGEFPFSVALEDIHMNIEKRLTDDIGEGQAVVVEPHGGLLVGLRTIPAGARSAQRSATEMPGERVGDAPLLALARLLRPSGQEIVVLVEVDYRVVNVERQCVGTCTDAVAVAYAVGNLIVTGHGENHRLTVDGGIGGLLAARKQPHGIARGIVEREGHGRDGGVVFGGEKRIEESHGNHCIVTILNRRESSVGVVRQNRNLGNRRSRRGRYSWC